MKIDLNTPIEVTLPVAEFSRIVGVLNASDPMRLHCRELVLKIDAQVRACLEKLEKAEKKDEDKKA